jgi:hypothetical protein
MTFTVFPILDWMAELYAEPISQDRFKTYLVKLQGNSRGDLELPIMAYNPMAKGHGLRAVNALRELGAEAIMQESLDRLKLLPDEEGEVRVVLNLADDVGGSWTNRHVTDYEATFRTSALVKRSFCTPYLWMSENYSEALIRRRCLAAAARFSHTFVHGIPLTLQDHIEQERFVGEIVGTDREDIPDHVMTFANDHSNSEDYALIFNFFYGDAASNALGYRAYGIPDLAGFHYAWQPFP